MERSEAADGGVVDVVVDVRDAEDFFQLTPAPTPTAGLVFNRQKFISSTKNHSPFPASAPHTRHGISTLRRSRHSRRRLLWPRWPSRPPSLSRRHQRPRPSILQGRFRSEDDAERSCFDSTDKVCSSALYPTPVHHYHTSLCACTCYTTTEA